MPDDRIEIHKSPKVAPFFLISLGLHTWVWLMFLFIPSLLLWSSCENKETVTKLPAVKVKYLPPEKKTPTQKLADIPKPRTIETPNSSELIARYDSRAHSNQSPKKHLRYKNKKTVVPKTKKSISVAKKSRSIPKKKTAPKSKTITIKKPFRPYDKGFAIPKNKGEISEKSPPKQITGGTLALLDGFDPEKYASMDTESETVEDDGEAISLNTKESRYASYFARIKHQIELVWDYPHQAQRKGITGELTLRFQISKEGNLMNVRLINSSGYDVLDEAALQAVKSAAPYYPFPVTIDRETLPILANFVYSPRVDAQYFKRP
jgi:periplasmic protein TonB